MVGDRVRRRQHEGLALPLGSNMSGRKEQYGAEYDEQLSHSSLLEVRGYGRVCCLDAEGRLQGRPAASGLRAEAEARGRLLTHATSPHARQNTFERRIYSLGTGEAARHW